MVRARGCIPTPRHRLAAATPHIPTATAPPQFANIPSKTSYWLNNQDGDCVTAEEAFLWATLGVFISDATVKTWATKNGVLNGADILSVIESMQKSGFQQDGNSYNAGAPTSVDWTNAATLQSAISQSTVKIGVAAGQLENAVGSSNGWFGKNFTKDNNQDHCVSLPGYGIISWLASLFNVTVPSGVDGTQIGWLLYTWNTIGIMTTQSLLNITGEAWLRTPGGITVGTGIPSPDPFTIYPTPAPPGPPDPGPPPVPSPNPIPIPGTVTLTLSDPLPAGNYTITPSGLIVYNAA